MDFGVNCPKILVKKIFLKWLGIWLISIASANKETEPQRGPSCFLLFKERKKDPGVGVSSAGRSGDTGPILQNKTGFERAFRQPHVC